MADMIKELHEEIKVKRSEKKEMMKRHIMEVSTEMFIMDGYEDTTMRKIALKSGYLIGSVYNIFKSKDEIFTAIMDEALDSVLSKSSELFRNEDKDLSQICLPICLIIYMTAQSKRVANLISAVSIDPNIRKNFAEYILRWIVANDVNDIIHVESGESKMKALACMGAFSGILTGITRSEEHVDVPELTKLMLSIIGNVFDVDTRSLDDQVERTYDIIRTNEIVICGVKI